MEPFDGTQDFGTSTPKILVFVNLGYSKLDTEISSPSATSGWFVEQTTGRVKTSYALEVPAIFASSGLWSIDENGKLIVQEVQTKKLCLEEICITKTELQTLLTNAGLIPAVSTSSPQAAPDTLGSSPTGDATPPTITILGNNPATIGVGATYSDMGVTVTDPSTSSGQVSNQNLGYAASLDGGPPLSQGAGLSLDTSTTTTHTILYTAIDSAGNIATSTRTVNVVEM